MIKPEKLTPADKLSILKLALGGLSQANIAKRFGITQSHVSLVIRGRR